MARVIKGGAAGGARPGRPAARVLAQSDQKKVIDRALYVARQEAEELLKNADDERRAILAEGKRRAAQAREEAMVRGASASFARAAEEALEAFRKRADRYGEAADDIRTLAHEIVRKVLGTDPDIAAKDVERIVQRGLAQLRARRRVRILLPTGRREELVSERPNLMKAVQSQPDLVIEDADDVRLGFARVVTEVGGALCAEESALDAVARAVNVHESPRARATAPLAGPSARTDGRAHAAAGADDDPGGGPTGAATAPGGALRRDRERTADLPAHVARAAGGARSALSRTSPYDPLPAADVDLHDPSSLVRDELTGDYVYDDDKDATRALPAPAVSRRSPAPVAMPAQGVAARALPSVAPRTARPDDARASSAMSRPIAAASSFHGDREPHRHEERVPTGRVQAGGRAATPVLDDDDGDVMAIRSRPAAVQRVDRSAVADDEDDELDLYTDAPSPRRR